MQYSLLALALLPALNLALARVVPRAAANLQSFTGALGGIAATTVTNSGNADRPFEVNGDTFVNFSAAQQRSCDEQFNACADAANKGAAFSVSQCQTQQTACSADSAEAGSGAATAGSGAAPAASNAGAATGSTCNQAAAAAAAAPPPVAADASSSSLDLGSCSNPTIAFGLGFDGRNQDSFEPANKTDFNHGSALNIGVISSFICGQLQSACKAGADAQAACASGEAAAAKATGQAAADAFNAAFA